MTINLLQMYEANYPEILKACYAINGVYIKRIISFYRSLAEHAVTYKLSYTIFIVSLTVFSPKSVQLCVQHTQNRTYRQHNEQVHNIQSGPE